jgi:hypothetical protein
VLVLVLVLLLVLAADAPIGPQACIDASSHRTTIPSFWLSRALAPSTVLEAGSNQLLNLHGFKLQTRGCTVRIQDGMAAQRRGKLRARG